MTKQINSHVVGLSEVLGEVSDPRVVAIYKFKGNILDSVSSFFSCYFIVTESLYIETTVDPKTATVTVSFCTNMSSRMLCKIRVDENNPSN